jgi:hypothetical protein
MLRQAVNRSGTLLQAGQGNQQDRGQASSQGPQGGKASQDGSQRRGQQEQNSTDGSQDNDNDR